MHGNRMLTEEEEEDTTGTVDKENREKCSCIYYLLHLRLQISLDIFIKYGTLKMPLN